MCELRYSSHPHNPALITHESVHCAYPLQSVGTLPHSLNAGCIQLLSCRLPLANYAPRMDRLAALLTITAHYTTNPTAHFTTDSATFSCPSSPSPVASRRECLRRCSPRSGRRSLPHISWRSR